MEGAGDAVVIQEGSIRRIKFGLSTAEEILKYSISESSITNAAQLGNSFLGLPLETGKCDSCGTAEIGKCEGHFGYLELPVPVYHPFHLSELRQLLSLICLKCLRMKKGKIKRSSGRDYATASFCEKCWDDHAVTLKEVKTADGAGYLELRSSSRKMIRPDFWNFLDRYGFHHGNSQYRPLLPSEVLNILKHLPEDTRKKLSSKGYTPQTGYVMKYLPVPPNCLYVPEFSDGQTVMTTDISSTLLRKVLKKIDQINKSRIGTPNFESHKDESNDLQISIELYMQLRGTTRGPQDHKKYAVGLEKKELSTKQWLEKMKTLFISKGSGYSSRSVITGDSYIGLNVIGLPSEIAKRITFEEQVTDHNIRRLQDVVNKGFCVTYRDGAITYAISVGLKGHTNLKVGQTVNRRIIDGDVVFINRPPSTHKHSLQAFYVYVHDDHTVKINPLICPPLGADFDGDCVHIYYPQSLAAKAEALELFSVEKQLISSHSGSLHLQIVHDSLLGLKALSTRTFLKKPTADQLAMFVSGSLPPPAICKAHSSGPYWTVTQILQNAFPAAFDCLGRRHRISHSEIIEFDLDRDLVQGLFSDVMSSLLKYKGPKQALKFLNMLQPLLMEILQMDGFSISLKDFDIPKDILKSIQKDVQRESYIIDQSKSSPNQFVELRVENNLKKIKRHIEDFVIKFTTLGSLIDAKSDSATLKVVQQIGFVGLQLYRQGRFYSGSLVEDCLHNFVNKYGSGGDVHPSEAYGLVKGSFFHGLNPYEEIVHSISSREAIVRSSRGLTEPGTLFKNLMAILRDVVICYDGSVRNICSNSIIQFEYKVTDMTDLSSLCPPGEPVGVLAATAISNPAYKAVLDSSQSNNTSWESMKEILLTRVAFKNDLKDRKVILFLNDCFCGKKFCKERAALAVQSCLKKVKLIDCATDFIIEHQKQSTLCENDEAISGLVGHIHLDKTQLSKINRSVEDVLQKCQNVILIHGKKKKLVSNLFKRLILTTSECCSAEKSNDGKFSRVPCLQFLLAEKNANPNFESFDQAVNALGHAVLPILLDTIIKGDPRIEDVKIVWIEPDAPSWVRNSRKASKGEPALEVVIEKDTARQNGDAWRTTMDACIPVLNLIDTRRSIPYGVQQVRELLGISCAFDQAVQRLSSAIRMVAKGILKDHLILVANSMTCTGSLNGFNTAGYKAMFRSLKVQVPFAESTLYTPIKCFERAADKCHEDSLRCVVSSCAWGQHAAVGTGASFQILWDDKHLANNDFGDGLYDFLANVRSTEDQSHGFSFLEDVDYLHEENDLDGGCMSPEMVGIPNFGDDDVDNALQNGSSWAKVDNNNVEQNSSWEDCVSGAGSGNNWGSWGSSTANKTSAQSEGQQQGFTKENPVSSSWDKPNVGGADTDNWGGWANGGASEAKSSAVRAGNCGVSDVWTDNRSTKPCGDHTLNQSNVEGIENVVMDSDHWNKRKADVHESSWRKQSDPWREQNSQDNPASRGPGSQENSDWGRSESEKKQRIDDSVAWNSKNPCENPNTSQSGWGEQPTLGKVDSGNKEASPVSDVCGNKPSKIPAGSSASWNEHRQQPSVDDGAWTSTTKSGALISPLKSGNEEPSGWDEMDTKTKPAEDSGGWAEKKQLADDADAWVSKSVHVERESSCGTAAHAVDNSWGARSRPSSGAESADAGTWGNQDSNPACTENKDVTQGNDEWKVSGAWEAAHSDNNQAQGSTSDAWNETKRSDGEKQGWKSDGWGTKSNNRRGQGQRNNSGRNPRNPDERKVWNSSILRRRPDLLTPEEEKIRVEVEPIMQRMKKILREVSGKLAEEDEKFILASVFEHHPDKESKVNGSIDHLMVAKHEVYQGSKCMHVVSLDGTSKDFSYIKCLESYVMKTFPEHGESFNMKYFRRSRREQTPATSTEATGLQTDKSFTLLA